MKNLTIALIALAVSTSAVASDWTVKNNEIHNGNFVVTLKGSNDVRVRVNGARMLNSRTLAKVGSADAMQSLLPETFTASQSQKIVAGLKAGQTVYIQYESANGGYITRAVKPTDFAQVYDRLK